MNDGVVGDLEVPVLIDPGEPFLCELFVHCPLDCLVDQLVRHRTARAREFDPFPFGLLTMIVSLEAIFLSTFILITQNRQEARSELRAEFDFRNNVRGEIWAAHIGQALGLDADHVEEVVRTTVENYLAEAEAQIE